MGGNLCEHCLGSVDFECFLKYYKDSRLFIEYLFFFKYLIDFCIIQMFDIHNYKCLLFQGFFTSICSWSTWNKVRSNSGWVTCKHSLMTPMIKEKAAASKIENFLVHACDTIPMINTNTQAIECLIRIGEDFSLETLKNHAKKYK